MSTPLALLILCFVGFAFGIFASASERSGLDIGIPVAVGMMLLSPVIGAMQHFWWGWPWWPVVIPAHAVTAFAGVIFFGLKAGTSRELERSQDDTDRSGDEYDLEYEWDEEVDWDEDDQWDVDGERAGSAEELDVEDESADANRRTWED